MKLLAVVLLVTLAGPDRLRAQAVYKPQRPAAPEARSYVNATVVAVDVQARTLTVRRDKGREEVLLAEGAALSRLKDLKPGQTVILSFRGTKQGDRDVVTEIKDATIAPPRRARVPTAASPRQARPEAASEISPPATPSPAPSPSPAPRRTRPPRDTAGPLTDPRKAPLSDPRLDPLRDPRVIPGLTEPAPTPTPSPKPTPTPR